MERLTLVLVEPDEVLRDVISDRLRSEGHSVIGIAAGAAAACELVERRRPDVVLVSLTLQDEGGIALTRRLLERFPSLALLIYAAGTGVEALQAALDTGANGFALAPGFGDDLVEAVALVGGGARFVDPRLWPLLRKSETRGLLSTREREVLELLAQGLTGQEASHALHLSPETIRTHVRNAMGKLRAHTRVHAVTLALSLGEIKIRGTIAQQRRGSPTTSVSRSDVPV